MTQYGTGMGAVVSCNPSYVQEAEAGGWPVRRLAWATKVGSVSNTHKPRTSPTYTFPLCSEFMGQMQQGRRTEERF